MKKASMILLSILSLFLVISSCYAYFNSQSSYKNIFSTYKYQIKYSSSGGTYSNSNLIYNGNKVSLPTPTRNGYNFSGYYSNNSAINTTNVDITTLNNKTIEARWNPINYSISYNYNGGSASNPTSYNIETNTFTLNNPTRQGYNFTGWSGSGSGTSVTINKGSTGNRSYTANWRKYDANDYGGIYLVATRDGSTWAYTLDGEYNVGTQNAHVGNWKVTVNANSVYIWGTQIVTRNRTYCFYIYAKNNHSQLLGSNCQYVPKGSRSEITIGW